MPFFRTAWSIGVLNSAIFNSFHNRVEFGTILDGLRNFGGGGGAREGGAPLPPPPPPPLGTPLPVSNKTVSRRVGPRLFLLIFYHRR